MQIIIYLYYFSELYPKEGIDSMAWKNLQKNQRQTSTERQLQTVSV